MSANVRASPKINHDVAIAALLTSPSIRAAADSIGVSERTLRRWMKTEEFGTMLTERQRELSQALHRGIIAKAQNAAAVLSEVMSDAENPPAARVSAANSLLNHAGRAIETIEILTRIEALEKQSEV